MPLIRLVPSTKMETNAMEFHPDFMVSGGGMNGPLLTMLSCDLHKTPVDGATCDWEGKRAVACGLRCTCFHG